MTASRLIASLGTGMACELAGQAGDERGLNSLISLNSQPQYPTDPPEEVFHGLAGEIVRTLEPHTEADPVAVLGQFLAAFGNVAGPGPFFRVEADRHGPKINVVLVGRTSRTLVLGQGERFHFDDMTELLRRDYRINKRRSLKRAERAIKHLRLHFANHRAIDITDHMVDAYVDHRLGTDNAANASVKYEIAVLKRMYRLTRKVIGGYKPEFPNIRVSNTRTGFFEESEFRALIQNLNEWVQAPMEFAYLTGWRLRSEVLTLQWKQVDFEAGEVRLEPGTTKNDEGRTFPFAVLPELEAMLRRQRESTDALQKATGRIIPWVFHHNGNRIVEYRKSWHAAIKKVGLTGKIPHDFRRTAVRNLERAGVPRSVAMRLVGHKTESIYRRYAIVARQDLVDGLKRLADYRAGLDKTPMAQKVVPITSAAM